MLGLIKKPDYAKASDYALRASSDMSLTKYHRFTPEELTQVKMLDLRQMMKDQGVSLFWMNGQYEGKCPFHEDKARSPRLYMNQKEGTWLWRCDGGHHGGTVIDFIQEAHQVNFPRAVEYLRGLITQVPKLNNNGGSIKEILEPIQQASVERIADSAEEKQKQEELNALRSTLNANEGLLERSEDSATFKYGDLIYHAKDLKNASKNSLKIILKLIYKDGHFTDRVDLHSARARRSFSNQAAERLNLQSAQIEEHLESLMESLEEESFLPPSTFHLPPHEMSEEEKSQALELLRDPLLLDRMSSDLDKLGYVGEEINKKILYLIGTSRLLDKPISAIIRSGSGAGKSALMEQVLSLMPEEDVLLFSRITPQSLFYMGKEALDRKILAIDEREGSQSADYSIRTLQSSGKLSFAAPTKDPKSGEWKTLVREFSARTPYIESSTKEKLNEENLNRCFELYLDESADQTKKILEAQRKEGAAEGLTDQKKDQLKRLYQNAQRLLSPLEVRIPSGLSVNLPEKWLRVRRDHERFLSLVKAITVLNQYKIEKKPGGSLEATTEDMDLAKELSKHVLGDVFDDMSKPIATFYELLKNTIKEKAKGIELEDFEFNRRQVREWLGLPDHIVKRSMKTLEDLEYVDVKKAMRGSRYIYRLVELQKWNSGTEVEQGLCPTFKCINTGQSAKVEQWDRKR